MKLLATGNKFVPFQVVRYPSLLIIFCFVAALSVIQGCGDSFFNDPNPAISQGIDVSRFQGAVDFKKVADSGVRFAFAKATQGTSHTDSEFSRNWSAMKEAGLIRGAYHYLEPNLDGAKQAKHFLSVVSLEPGDLPPAVDVERTNRDTNEELLTTLTQYLEEIRTHTGRNAIIYVSPAFWNEHLEPKLEKALPNPLWIAEYNVKSPRQLNKLPPWTFWQHSQNGRTPGVKGPVDLDHGRNLDTLRISH